MITVYLKQKNSSYSDVLSCFTTISSLIPDNYKGITDTLVLFLSSLEASQISNYNANNIFHNFLEIKKDSQSTSDNDLDSLYLQLIECFVILIDAKLQKELFENSKSSQVVLQKAEIAINKVIKKIFANTITLLHKQTNVSNINENNGLFLFDIGDDVVPSSYTTIDSAIEQFVTYWEGISIDNKIFYTPPKAQRKGIWSSIFHAVPDIISEQEKWKEYRQEINKWLPSFIQEISDNQEIIGKSTTLASFLWKYCSIVRKNNTEKIKKEKGWHTNICRYVAFFFSIVIVAGGGMIGYFFELSRRALAMTEEMQRPRYPYLPPEIDDTPKISNSVIENLWIYSTIEKVLIGLAILGLLEFLLVELRIFKPNINIWKEYFTQIKAAFNYTFNIRLSRRTKLVLASILPICLIIFGIVLYHNTFSQNSKALTQVEVLDSMAVLSPSDGAMFYLSNKDKIEFMDSLYSSNVFPAIESCDYLELKNILSILVNTKFEKQIRSWMKDKRNECLNIVKKELIEKKEQEIASVDKYIIPTLELELDSLIEENVDEILNSYSGGLFNYKKLAFIVGRDSTQFKTIFKEKINYSAYNQCVKEYTLNCIYILNHQQNKYCKLLTKSSFVYKAKFSLPNVKVYLSNNTINVIQDYTVKEKKEVTYSAITDFAVPVAIGFVSGGASLLYDLSTMTYDIIKELTNNEIKQEDIARYLCEEDIAEQIKDLYKSSVRSQLVDYINKSNESLYHKIKKEL